MQALPSALHVLKLSRLAGRVALRLTQPTALLPIFMLACALPLALALAQSPPAKPRVPPGVDPGGVAIAIIGNGIDYTRPQIAARLARDGEGEIIGWDFVDNDRRPFQFCNPVDPSAPCANDFLGWMALAEKPAVRFIFMRASSSQPQTLVQAAQSAARTPAKVVFLASFPPPPLQFLVEASQRSPQQIFVALIAGGEAKNSPEVLGSNFIGVHVGPTAPTAHFAHAAARIALNALSTASGDHTLDGQGIMKRLHPRIWGTW